jgi:hypothetical protein
LPGSKKDGRLTFSAIHTDGTPKWVYNNKEGEPQRIPTSWLPSSVKSSRFFHDIKAETRDSSIQHETSEREAREAMASSKMLPDMTLLVYVIMFLQPIHPIYSMMLSILLMTLLFSCLSRL